MNARFSVGEEKNKNKPLCIIEQPGRHIWDLSALSQDNLMFAQGEGYLAIMDIKNLKCVKMIKCCNEAILCLDLSSDKTKLAIVDSEDTLRVWKLDVVNDEISRVLDFDNMRLQFTKHLSKQCRKVTFSPNGTTLCCICDDSHVYGWDTEKYEFQFDIPLKNGERGLSQLFFSENSLLVSTTEGIRYLTLPEGREKSWQQCHSDFVSALDMSKDGKYLISASHDGRIFYYI